MNKTQTLINRIREKESFYDVAYLCEDFETFEIEVAEWGVDHAGGVDFDDPEVDRKQMDAFFASFGCTPENPHPCSKFADPIFAYYEQSTHRTPRRYDPYRGSICSGSI